MPLRPLTFGLPKCSAAHLTMFMLQEGSIGHELVIKPVPTDISQEEDGSVHHVIYKRKTPEEHNDQLSDYAFMEPDRLQKRFRAKRSPQAYYKSSRAIDRTIYPEILVIVDYDGYRLHGGDNVQVKRYFVSFWNGVDLRYRLLKGPKIRISIAGIIISRKANTLTQQPVKACRTSVKMSVLGLLVAAPSIKALQLIGCS
uniref:Uncharacterized protein n=1 Tax=Anopheles atroparvus TaxID=41427 RepID=A0A182IKB5_ANOAO